MSNYLAIATVTAALASLVRDTMRGVPNLASEPDVRIARPLPEPDFVGALLFLYRVAPIVSPPSARLPARNPAARVIARPGYAADLNYLLSFHGDDQTLEPQRLLGRVVTALHAEPVLSAARVRAAIDKTAELQGSTLDRAAQPVRIAPIALDLEDLARVWSLFYDAPNGLALAYAASGVLLDAETAPA